MNKSYKKWLVMCFGSVLLMSCFHHFVSKQIGFVTYSNGNFRIQDYAYHIIIVKTFWFDSFGDIYKLSFQQQALSAYIGSQISTVMPLGITPIALVVWLPFAFVSCYSMAFSYTLWITFSITILITAFRKILRNFYPKKNLSILPITLSIITLFSATTFRTLHLGQTSVLAAGLIIHLIYLAHKTTNSLKLNNILAISLLIFILGMKPTYIVLGLGLLMIYGFWREAIYSVATAFALFVGITPLLTITWVPSYLNLLHMYSLGKFPEFYAWAIVPETMNIFRSAFRDLIGDNIAGLISNIVTHSTYIGVMGLSMLSIIGGKHAGQVYLSRIKKDQLFILVVASYLLFAPYAGAYEDVLLLTVFVTVLIVGNTPPLTSYKSLILIFFLFFILLHNIFPPNKPLCLFWILKAVILGYMLVFCRLPPKEKRCATRSDN